MGGQLLFAAACFVLLAALKPVLRFNWARLFVFAVTLYTPASWAENTLRVYRDNIYPSLVLLALSGLLGAFVRLAEKPVRALPYYIVAGLSLAAAWLCHEDNVLLLPFVVCAAAVYLAFLFLGRDVRNKKSRLALLLVPLALWGGGIAAWSGMNYKYYGRFIVSDFTSKEFNDAMGALSRACPDDQQRYVLLPRSTRLALYQVSPTFAKIQDTLETPDMYNGYGDTATGELNSGGIHWALRKTLGSHVRQAGTHKTAERMRFDFAHFEALTPAQLHEVEQLVNERILDNAKVACFETEFDQKPEGTLAFFGEKYGKVVRVVDVGGYSRELCGGTHVSTTGEIGLIKIVSESAIAAGTRRLEIVAGQAALDFIAEREAVLANVGSQLSAGPLDVAKKLDAVLAQKAELEKKLKAFEQKAAAGLSEELAAKATLKGDLKFVSAVVSVDAPDALRTLGTQVLQKLGEGVVVLGAALGEKATVVAFCSPAAIKAGHQAGKIVNELSQKLGGKGGGKPDFAMGGGKEPAKLAEVIQG